MAQTHANSSLRLLCLLSGFYGVSFGVMMIPSALFVGPHLLIGAGVHILLGAIYLVLAIGVHRGMGWPNWPTFALSATIAITGTAFTRQSLTASDGGGIIFWTGFTAWFACIAIVALREILRSRVARAEAIELWR